MNDVMMSEVRGEWLEIITGSGNRLVTHFNYHWFVGLAGPRGTETDPPGRAFILLPGNHQISSSLQEDIIKAVTF